MGISIIGMGVVGQALYANVRSASSVATYDKSFDNNCSEFDKESNITRTDAVIICVDTPTILTNEQNPERVTSILDILIEKEYLGIVIIKSTILYKNIEKYSHELKIVINPEFLNARTAQEDFKNEKYMVLGGYIEDTMKAKEIIQSNFNFNNDEMKYEYVTIKQAIDFKYMRNIKQSYNVLFWEFVQDFTGDAEKMATMLRNIPVGENSQASKDGYRGYGQSINKNENNYSACLDKDVSAMYHETGHILLKYVKDYNEGLM